VKIPEIDELYRLLKRRKRIPLSEAAAILGISQDTALAWAKLLHDDDKIPVFIEVVDGETQLVWRELASSAMAAAKPVPEREELMKKPLPATEREFTGLVEAYRGKIEEIKRRSEMLNGFVKQRAQIIYKKYIPLERRYEAELQLLHDQLAEKEREIADLEKRVNGIPGRVKSVEAKMHKLAQVEVFARRNAAEARNRIQAEYAKIRETQETVEKLLREVTKHIEVETVKLKKVEKELARLRKIEQWMMVQQVELEKELGDVAEERKGQVKGIATLKGSVTDDYVKAQVNELRGIKARYYEEMQAIREEEQELGEKAETTRREIARLTDESKALLSRFEIMSKKKRKEGKVSDEWKEFEREATTAR